MLILNRIGIQSKLVLLLLFVSLGSIGVVGWLCYQLGSKSLESAIRNHLQGIRVSKTNSVKTHLEALRDQVVAISDSQKALEAMRAFKQSYAQINDPKNAKEFSVNEDMIKKVKLFYENDYLPKLEQNIEAKPNIEQYMPKSNSEIYLQYHYIVNNKNEYLKKEKMFEASDDKSSYAEAHKKFHPFFKRATEIFGFEDMMLVDADSLEIIYTYEKTVEFATNLEAGPFADTNLGEKARSLKKTKDRDDFKIADMERYRPNLGKPMGFVFSPIFDGPKMLGILVLQYPIDTLNSIMSGNLKWEAEGLGKTGKTYLVGPDFTLRTQSRVMVENPSGFISELRQRGVNSNTLKLIEHFQTVTLLLDAKTPSTQLAMQGREGIHQSVDYRGIPVLSAYGPVDMDSIRWAVVAEISMDEAFAPTRELFREVVVCSAGLAIIVTIIALLFSHIILRPIHSLYEAAKRVSLGDTHVKVKITSRDEFRDLALAFNQMTESLIAKNQQLEDLAKSNHQLLLNILPASIANLRLEGKESASQGFEDVSVLFAEIGGLHVGENSQEELFSLSQLCDLVVAFDEAADSLGVEKVKTVGESYLAVCGLSVNRPDHPSRMIQFAETLCEIVKSFNKQKGLHLTLTIGVNSGPVIGGVVGRRKFLYDLWGDTVRLAKGLGGVGGNRILVSEAVYVRLREIYDFEGPDLITIPGKQSVKMWKIKD
jgi:class 3 adenylate cyclase